MWAVRGIRKYKGRECHSKCNRKKTPLSNVLIIQHIRIYNPEKEIRNSLEGKHRPRNESELRPR